jgi:hypothetical protein
MPFSQIMFQELQSDKVIVAPSKEQNYRKYFDMRKKYSFDIA